MTTIAYRDGIIAGDSRGTAGNIHDCAINKVARNKDGDLAGATGTAAYCSKFLAWFSGGEKSDPPSPGESADDNDYGVVVRSSSGEILCFERPGNFAVKAPYMALGSGRQLALGAMANGASAEQAVAAAMKHDIYTGGPVLALSHKGEGV